MYRADPQLCERLAAVIARRAGRDHLVAALAADPLSQASTVTDPDAPGFTETSLPSSVGEALSKYLDRLPSADQARVRGLLTALAYARGSGVSDDLWLGFAGALGFPVTAADLDALRRGAAVDYLLQSSTVEGVRVTRLFHQALADELLAHRARANDESKRLACLRPAPPRTWLDAESYARTFAAEHAAAGQLEALLQDPTFPTVTDLTRLLPLLPATPPPGSAPVVTVLRTAAPQAAGLPPSRRAWLLALAAAHLGQPEVTRRFHRPGTPAVAWAHVRGVAHQTLIGHTDAVTAVAIGHGAAGRDIIATASDDRTARIWDATTGTELAVLDVLAPVRPRH